MAGKTLFENAVKFLVMPLTIASIMYALVHIQLLFLHKFLRVDISHSLRTKICIATFMASFFVVILLVGFGRYVGYI